MFGRSGYLKNVLKQLAIIPLGHFEPATVGVADGNGYWDALTGAPLVGSRGGALVLVPHGGLSYDGAWRMSYDPYCIDHFVKSHAGSVSRGYVFGGEAVVSKRAFDACAALTRAPLRPRPAGMREVLRREASGAPRHRDK